jgi:hypothetical protein
MRPASQEGQGSPVGDAVFDAAVADLHAGLDAQRPLRPQVTFEDVPAPRRLAPHAVAIAATVRAAGGADQPDVAWGRLVLLYDPDGQPGWAGQLRVIAYIRADVEAEMAADPLLGKVSWSWLTEALDARAAGYAAPSGTVTTVVTEGFGGKQDEPTAIGLELRASWSPSHAPAGQPGAPPAGAGQASAPPASARQADASPAPAGQANAPPVLAGQADAPPAPAGQADAPPVLAGQADAPPAPVGQADALPALAGHVAAWCDALCAAAGLPPAAAGVSALPRPRRP